MATKPIVWDETKDRRYEYGVSKGVLFPMADSGYAAGVAWNGLTNVSDKPEGGEVSKIYADNIEYAAIQGVEKYKAGIEAYMYPDEFAVCDGSAQPIPGMYIGQQTRKPFGLCWRTEIGNADNQELGYKLHIAYGLRAAVTEKSHGTVNENVEPGTMSWDAEGSPVAIPGYKPSAKIEFDSTVLGAKKMKALEDILYGTETVASRLPTPTEIMNELKKVTT